MALRTYIVGGVPVKTGGRWTLEGIDARSALPDIGLSKEPSVWDRADFDVAHFGLPFVIPVQKPVFDATTQSCEEVAPVLIGGTWTQAWHTSLLTAAEIEARRLAAVPQQVTMRQARLALLGAGLLGQVNTAIAAMPGVDGDAARIEWEFAAELQRTNPLVLSLGAALSLTSTQMDDLFIAAGAL